MTRRVPIPGGELRYNDDPNGAEELDEVVARDVKSVHIEVMDDRCIWMGLTLQNGQVLHCRFVPKLGRAHVRYHAELDALPKLPTPGNLVSTHEELMKRLAFAEQNFDDCKRIRKRRDALVAQLEESNAMACITPSPECDCAGCSYARKQGDS